MNIPWLTLLIAVPLVGAIVTAFLPRTTLPRYVALAVSVLTLVGAGIVAAGYDAGGGMQFTEEVEWISVFGAHYALGVDGLGLLMILLTAVLVPIELADRSLGALLVAHLDKSETTCLTSRAIPHDVDARHRSGRLEQGLQIGLGCLVRQVADV